MVYDYKKENIPQKIVKVFHYILTSGVTKLILLTNRIKVLKKSEMDPSV